MFRSGPYDRGYNRQGGSERERANFRANPGSLDDPTMEAYVSRTLYLCKLPYDLTEEAVRELCEPFGDLKKVAVYPQKGIAFVEYYDIREAEKARNSLKNSTFQGRVIDVQYSRGRDDRPSRDTNTGTLYVRPVNSDKSFHDPNSLEDYKQLFSAYGEVKKVSANRKREAEKFIEFHDTRGAEGSQKALNGYDFNGVILEIQFANTHSRTVNAESKLRQSKDSSNYSDNQRSNDHSQQMRGGPMRSRGYNRGGSPDNYDYYGGGKGGRGSNNQNYDYSSRNSQRRGNSHNSNQSYGHGYGNVSASGQGSRHAHENQNRYDSYGNINNELNQSSYNNPHSGDLYGNTNSSYGGQSSQIGNNPPIMSGNLSNMMGSGGQLLNQISANNKNSHIQLNGSQNTGVSSSYGAIHGNSYGMQGTTTAPSYPQNTNQSLGTILPNNVTSGTQGGSNAAGNLAVSLKTLLSTLQSNLPNTQGPTGSIMGAANSGIQHSQNNVYSQIPSSNNNLNQNTASSLQALQNTISTLYSTAAGNSGHGNSGNPPNIHSNGTASGGAAGTNNWYPQRGI